MSLEDGFYFRVLNNGDHSIDQKEHGDWYSHGSDELYYDSDMLDCKSISKMEIITAPNGDVLNIQACRAEPALKIKVTQHGFINCDAHGIELFDCEKCRPF